MRELTIPARLVAEGEEWRPTDTTGNYWVSTHGRVWSVRSERMLKPGRSNTGYVAVFLYHQEGPRSVAVHVLVLEAFEGPRPAKAVARHLDGTRDNNRVENLRWGTRAENIEDMRRHGRLKVGEDHPQAKLTRNDVLAIRAAHARGERRREIASRFGISKSHVGRIVHRRAWSHV